MASQNMYYGKQTNYINETRDICWSCVMYAAKLILCSYHIKANLQIIPEGGNKTWKMILIYESIFAKLFKSYCYPKTNANIFRNCMPLETVAW